MEENLQSLLVTVRNEIQRRDLVALRTALISLLTFLASPTGRTDSNCRTVGSFFSSIGFIAPEPEWAHLPESYQAVLWDMGAQLDDTFSAPEIAVNFWSTPEQLLERAKALEADGPVT